MRFLLSLSLMMCVGLAATSAERPNIVYFLADDLGWKDVGYHGSEIKTPNIDKLAAGGVKLEQFYVQPVCSPTRAALMTGRYPIRMGLQVGVIRPWADYGLPLDERMLSTALKEAGYTTAICGKWHLGLHAPEFLPTRRGFDHQYGHYCGALDYFTHKRDGGHDWHRNDKANYDEGYTTTLIGKEATTLVEKHDGKKPLFLYVPFNSPHTPLQVPESYLEPYADIKNPKRKTFAGMVAAMDESIGRVVDALDKKGMRENTLIIFHSDNGGPTRLGADNGPLRAGKGTVYEGGTRVPTIANWPDTLKPSTVEGMIHVVDMHPTLVKLAGGNLGDKPLDGKDVWATIAEGKASPRTEIVYNIVPNSAALRVGDWKLVRSGMKQELFNLADDPYEKTDLAEKEPAKLKEIRQKLREYASSAVEPKSKPQAKDFKAPKIWGEQE